VTGITALRQELDHWCGYGSRSTLSPNALQFDKKAPATPKTFSPALTTLVWPPQRHGWNCRRTVHRRTCNADGSEQRDLTPNSSPSTVSSPKLRSGKFTDDYMERTKGTTDLKSTSRHSPLAWIRIAHQDRPRSTRKESALDTGRGVQRHPVVNEDGSNTVYKVKVEGADHRHARQRSTQAYQQQDRKATVDDSAVADYYRWPLLFSLTYPRSRH
jgi:hypothetical protein